jgi:hypothetical protein
MIARHREHLLFAARQRACQLIAPFLQARKQLDRAFEIGVDVAFRA